MQQQLVQLGSTVAAGIGERGSRGPAEYRPASAAAAAGGPVGLSEALWELGRWQQRAEELEGQLDLVRMGGGGGWVWGMGGAAMCQYSVELLNRCSLYSSLSPMQCIISILDVFKNRIGRE